MRPAELLEALEGLPDDASLTVSVNVGELRAHLERRDENPDRLVGTTWASENLGKSREWWATQAEKIPGAFQEKAGAPWQFTIRAARAHIARYLNQHRGKTGGPRGPRRSAPASTS